jgi:hypothetical protein
MHKKINHYEHDYAAANITGGDREIFITKRDDDAVSSAPYDSLQQVFIVQGHQTFYVQ